MMRACHAALLALGWLMLATTVHAQEPEVSPPGESFLAEAVAVSGHATVSGELYQAGGIDARRPGSIWRMNTGANTSLFGGMSLQVDLVASTEGVDFRQNMNQLGLSPSWDWGGFSVGDFSMDYSPYVIQGTRVRGAGVRVDPGGFRVSAQGGRLERAEALTGDAHQAYNRNMVAGRGGVGSLQSSNVNVTLLKAWDVPADRGFIAVDTLFLDTIPQDLRPEVETRPQESLAMAVDGQTRLFGDRLDLSGEVATSLLTRDREASVVEADPPDGVLPGGGGDVGGLADVRISSSVDHAYRGQARLALGPGRLEARYERVGAGFGSLALPYLMNDLRSYDIGGAYQGFQGRVAIQGKYLNQVNNLESQRRNTVDRNTVQLNLALRPLSDLTANLSGMRTTMSNDAEDELQRLDNVTTALTTSLALRHGFLGLESSTSLSHSVQLTDSDDAWIGASWIVTHSIGLSHRVRFSRSLSIAPSVSTVITRGTGLEQRRNLRLGFKGTGRFIDERLRTTASVSHATSQGRDQFGVRGQVSYPVFWGTALSGQVRHMRYTAMGQRPAFDETFLTFSLSRSF